MSMDACKEPARLKLNLGCGSNKIDGYINIDKYSPVADLSFDLEQTPWPFDDGEVDDINASHVMEHLGADANVFIGIMRELYRVCRPGARIHIAVPHPRHDNFIGDPTHVRVITPQVMSLFSKQACRDWQAKGYSNTPLALYHDVDFELREVTLVPDWKYQKLPQGHLVEMAATQNNIIAEIRMVLEVIK